MYSFRLEKEFLTDMFMYVSTVMSLILSTERFTVHFNLFLCQSCRQCPCRFLSFSIVIIHSPTFIVHCCPPTIGRHRWWWWCTSTLASGCSGSAISWIGTIGFFVRFTLTCFFLTRDKKKKEEVENKIRFSYNCQHNCVTNPTTYNCTKFTCLFLLQQTTVGAIFP